MPKRLGYKTDACMMLIRREVNEWMIASKINKSRLVNDLLLKYYEWELCRHCLGGANSVGKCKKCGEPWVRCENEGSECQDRTVTSCGPPRCTWDEVHGL